ncbi:PO21 protein, partial [Piprites chloris]|nr:PO21 protein [Piprites chloris]
HEPSEHQHILMGLKQKGVDPHIIHIVKNMHENIYNWIDTKYGKSDQINMQVGVKQGDPMSLLLFDPAVDPLLSKLEECGNGFQQGKNIITVMALAEDLVLLSGSWEGMKNNIKILETYELTGLRTQEEK